MTSHVRAPASTKVDSRPEACRASSDAVGAAAIHRIASAVLATVAWLPFLVAPLTFPPARWRLCSFLS
jgi:hypothetical protein